jgi:hypothetical protein
MFTYEIYAMQYCSVHKTHIMYFKSNKIMNETQCWSCVYEVNQKKFNKERKLSQAKAQFAVDYSHLWVGNLVGGIVGVRVKEGGLTVEIESSPEAAQQIPETYQDFHIVKEIVGE